MKTKLTVWIVMLAMASWGVQAAQETRWFDGFEDGRGGSVWIDVAFPGVWSGPGGVANRPRLVSEEYSLRPAGMISGTRAPCGPTGGHFSSTRSLGRVYTTGIVSVDGWLQSRSSDGNTGNYAGLGLSSVDMGTGIGLSELMVIYRWNTAAIAMWNSSSVTLTFGDAYGTSGASPTNPNTDPVNYNQYQHVKLEVDLDAQIARMYLDVDQTTPDGPWTQRGSDVNISGMGIPAIGYASLMTSRDGTVDDMTVTAPKIPEPATLALLAVGMIGLLRRRR